MLIRPVLPISERLTVPADTLPACVLLQNVPTEYSPMIGVNNVFSRPDSV